MSPDVASLVVLLLLLSSSPLSSSEDASESMNEAAKVPFIDDILQPSGPHVCTKNMTVMVNATEEFTHTETYFDTVFCFDIARMFKCPVEKTRVTIKTRPVIIESVEPIDVCCEGFRLNANETLCKEIPKPTQPPMFSTLAPLPRNETDSSVVTSCSLLTVSFVAASLMVALP